MNKAMSALVQLKRDYKMISLENEIDHYFSFLDNTLC